MRPDAIGILFLILGTGAGLARAQQPVTMTTTADFRRGNIEGLIGAGQDRLTRLSISGGAISSWSNTTALPATRLIHGSATYNGYIYVVGGANSAGNDTTTVYYAALNANGSVGGWGNTTVLPSARSTVACVAYNGFLFVIGGSATGVFSDVLVATINADGTVGAWNYATALPSGRSAVGAVAWDNFLYVLGGSPNAQSGYADVYVAPIHANGTIGSWTSTTALPSQRYALTAAAYGGYLYAIAGTPSPQSGLAQVLYASINANGTIGSWNTTSALPSGRYFHSSAVYNGHLYVMGGLTNGYFSDTLVALINDDGTLESWTATSSLPAVRAAHTSVLSDGFIYTLGGYSGGYLSSVIMANVSAGSDDSPYAPLLRGIYSRVFDVQADSSTLSVLINGWYQRGANIRLEVRVAPGSTGIFGSRIVFDAAIVGSPITLAPTGRWVWVRLILDDTASEDVAEPAYVTDLTVSPFPPPLPPLPPSPPPPEEPPPDPAAPVPSITPEYPEPKDTILPCSAGASANPMGILAMGLLVLAGAIWRQTRRAIPS